MTAIRRYVRAVAMTWLLCQVASLSAFVPEECCDRHTVAAADGEHQHHAEPAPPPAEECHEAPAPEPVEGDTCPMHKGTQSRSHECCAITNTCDGPGTHLLSLFAFTGEVERPSTPSSMLDAGAAFTPPPPPLLGRLSLPDAPPPKN
ncbi:MAG TPA: hypothetical protein VNT81_21600 [Vicinamibacterales bacterium]|nr:hypothetical protein [Vicinamibacterales bacterium]